MQSTHLALKSKWNDMIWIKEMSFFTFLYVVVRIVLFWKAFYEKVCLVKSEINMFICIHTVNDYKQLAR